VITVLRYGHRPQRDKRITTHTALVSRAFGADRFVLAGPDEVPCRTVNSVTKRCGGKFTAENTPNWRKFLRDFKGVRVHLTMYGLPLSDVVDKLRSAKDMLVFVGAEKVPPDVYQTCEYNVSVGNQPHSEVAALAVFLDRITQGKWEKRDFGGKLKVVPQERGKKMEEE
jgi:tRNA (cytidine56-2'-O)-methyltransferase